jgi:hypothetical protein
MEGVGPLVSFRMDINEYEYTVKPVLRGHLWNKVKVAL